MSTPLPRTLPGESDTRQLVSFLLAGAMPLLKGGAFITPSPEPSSDLSERPVSGQVPWPFEPKTAEDKAFSLADLEKARSDTETNPTEAQKAAGNYPKGRFRYRGLEIVLENPKGSVRRGVTKDGVPWETEMQHDYGYVRRTEGADGDHLDIFLGPDLNSWMVHVINQKCPTSGKFDEHKVVVGCRTAEDAKELYHANYQKGWKGFHSVITMPFNRFKEWLKEDTTVKAKNLRKMANADGAPYRERAEVYAYHPQHGVYGGQWNTDKTFAVPGGGIDEGEDIATAAAREFLEETGMQVKNPRLLPVDPVTVTWSDQHRATLPPEKQKFQGSRTHFVLADLEDTATVNDNLDQWSAGDRRFYPLDEALGLGEGGTPLVPNVYAARKKVLNHLKALAASTPSTKAAGVADWLEGSQYWQSLLKTPLRWQSHLGIIDNVKNHLGRAYDQGTRRVHGAIGVEQMRRYLDPTYNSQWLANKMQGIETAPQIHPLDQIIGHGPLQTVQKLASRSLIPKLKRVKQLSDQKQYKAKTRTLQKMMRDNPSQWHVDSRQGHISGVTHSTGFRFHMPTNQIPSGVRRK